MSRYRRARIEPYLDRLFGFALTLADRREEAEDLVQDCVVRALAARRVPRDEAAYRAWLFTIVRNAFLDQTRKRGQLSLDDDDSQATSVDWTVLSGDEQRMVNVLTVRAGMSRLKLRQREIIAMVDIAGFSYAEAACQLGIPVGTVMSRLSRARHALLLQIDQGVVMQGGTRAGGAGR